MFSVAISSEKGQDFYKFPDEVEKEGQEGVAGYFRKFTDNALRSKQRSKFT